MNEIELFWKRFLDAKGLDESTKYLEAFHFELTKEWANKLLELVLVGKKRATASSLEAWKIEGIMPKVGDYSIVTDWNCKPRCVIQTINITTLLFKDITYDICKREGEDDCLETWRQGHINFFTEEGKEIGYEFSEDMLVVFEDFKVVYQE